MLNLYFIIYAAWLLLASHSVRTMRRPVNSMFVSIDCYYLFISSFICVMLAICMMLYRQIRKHWQSTCKCRKEVGFNMSDQTKDSLANCSIFKNSGVWQFFFHLFSDWRQRGSAGVSALIPIWLSDSLRETGETYGLIGVLWKKVWCAGKGKEIQNLLSPLRTGKTSKQYNECKIL